MTDPAIIEAAARVLRNRWLKLIGIENDGLPTGPWLSQWLSQAEEVLAAVTPLIEAAALERAAKMVEEGWGIPSGTPQDEVAAAIRALKQEADELDRHTLMGPPSDFNEL